MKIKPRLEPAAYREAVAQIHEHLASVSRTHIDRLDLANDLQDFAHAVRNGFSDPDTFFLDAFRGRLDQ